MLEIEEFSSNKHLFYEVRKILSFKVIYGLEDVS